MNNNSQSQDAITEKRKISCESGGLTRSRKFEDRRIKSVVRVISIRWEEMAQAFALFSVPTPRETRLYKRDCITRNSWEIVSYSPWKFNAPLCYPSSATVVEDGPSSPDALPVQSDSAADDALEIPPSGCRTCGREEIEKGCNGEGRIQGGIATVPGFGWWPIKAYRPCPGFVASGGRYRRRGQSMDEVAFGRGEKASSRSGSDKKSSEKKEGSRKFKK
ncbi:uncharacterized protein LOC129322264 [Prosopis cineraria]|uniref:uncharacterized protein LOC129322264 n=1 Tax=Prosopis cineraria TaxID=364024 RepID=UPI00240F39C5|nr:uncharacterized protein LOC129322264 [Prosopis cineraria]